MTLFRPESAFLRRVAIAGCLVLCGLAPRLWASQYSLTDPGFNSTSQPLLPAGTFVFDRWEVEAANLVVGPQAGVAPFEGDGMLRMNVTGGVLSQVWQFLDLTGLQTQINAGNVSAEAYVFMNSAQGHTPTSALRLTGRSGNNANFFLRPSTVNSTVAMTLDGSAATWQKLSSTTITLPPGTNLLELELDYTNASLSNPDFAFADLAYVCLHVVPEPAGVGMILGTVILGIHRRRRRARPDSVLPTSDALHFRSKLMTKSTSVHFLSWVALGLALAFSGSPVQGQIEPIGPLTLVPNQPVNFVFTNLIPPNPRYKELQFTGFANVPPGTFGTLGIEFDYIDPSGVNVLVPAPNTPIMVIGGNPLQFDSGILTLPFCPQVVSLHLTNLATAAAVPIDLVGRFRHECFPVPEPGMFAWGAGALTLLAGWRRRAG